MARQAKRQAWVAWRTHRRNRDSSRLIGKTCLTLVGVGIGSWLSSPAIALHHGSIAQNPPTPMPGTPPPLVDPPTLTPLGPEDFLTPTAPPLPDVPTPPSAVEPDGDVPATIVVNAFEFEGNTAFSDAELAEITQGFVSREISFSELLSARSAITQHYIDQGFITSGAFIPPQTLDRGTVTIQILEGLVEQINITGNRRLRPEYIRRRLAIATEAPLNVNRLLAALQLLRLNPLIANLSAELATGVQPGTSILEVQVTEADSLHIDLQADNGRNPSVGTFRRGVTVTEGNLLGWGDELRLTYANTDGSDQFEGRYTLPINAGNGTLSFYVDYNDSTVITPPFDVLDIQANSWDTEFTYRQPLYQTPSQELAIGLTLARREGFNYLLDTPFPLSPGANDQGETRLAIARFFQEWLDRDRRSVLALRSQFSLGTSLFNATVNNEGPDGQFWAWRGQAQWLRLLAPDTVVLLRSDIQLAANPLVPLEQFGLGGHDTVRGYPQNYLLSDSGVFASAELRFPILRVPREQTLVQLTPFIDFGTAWNHSGNPGVRTSTLLGAGLGLRWQQGDTLTMRLDYGIPLINGEKEDNTLQEKGLYFAIVLQPF
ncbi:ShlB/FhaC/HecB family hemolysin secretion/activation protein [Trichothermofontia sichuanensis B231]|uniref:ShlB/FhaC/HecB family hemolysin secretion/activation protein n=1 Tax=Trichothermofontia sichuanensis TaxID=3045816 RepID=UPI00224554D9|nr:ShlB/FhaC/HecB family hemolysin secretion/activation protein [Trichothermofontia sichuanensis]UZQ55054.1 ShlB/FhaC/HecB family hemolysin secretion/activation protein [Trichothermofontia sichuanensis B231]